MRWVGVCVFLGLCTGCIRGGAAQTLFTLGTGAVATENLQPKACLYVLGAMGGFRGMSLLIAHGNASLEECMRIHQELQTPTLVTPAVPPP